MTSSWIRAALAAVALSTAGGAAAATKTYQVTGPVVEVTDKAITVQKGKEKWEIARTADTKSSGEVKAGDKVTVVYTMTATAIESKGGAKPAKNAASK
jgi:hypothetical protein